MRILLAVLSTTVLAGAALAQQQPAVTPPVAPQGTIQAKGAIAECDRLISYLEETHPVGAGVTVEQATAWRQTSNFEACRESLRRVAESKPDSYSTHSNQAGSPGSADGPTGLPTLTSSGLPASDPAATPNPPPQAQAGSSSAGAPQVVVQQAQPSVTVRQRQPEIIVRQAPPIITVQQPQPEIIVRMPEPEVNVSVSRPEVQVNIPQPLVQVVPPQAQPQVQTQGQQPNVRVERTGEPRVVYQPAEGQPQIRYESAGPTGTPQTAPVAGGNAAGQPQSPSPAPATLSPQAAQAQLNGAPAGPGNAGRAPEPAQTGALSSAHQAMPVSKLEDMSVYNGRGEKLGDVEKVLMGADSRSYVLLSHGGFLGLGSKQVAISSDQLVLRGDRLIAETLTDDQVRAFPEFKESANFKEMDDDQTASFQTAR